MYPTQPPQGPRLPDKAYPLAIFAGDTHVTPDKVRLEITDGRLHLWIGPMSITVDLKGADEALTGGGQLLARIRQEAERAGAYIAAEENGRAARTAAEASAAASHAAEHHA